MITKVQGKTVSGELSVKACPRLNPLEKAMLRWAVVDPEDRVLDADFRISSVHGVEEQGGRIGCCCSFFLVVGQCGFRFRFQRFLLLLYQGNGIVVFLLCSNLLLARTAQKTESYQ